MYANDFLKDYVSPEDTLRKLEGNLDTRPVSAFDGSTPDIAADLNEIRRVPLPSNEELMESSRLAAERAKKYYGA